MNEFRGQFSPRTIVFSVRNHEHHVSRACGYEFEDLICDELDDALLIAPDESGYFEFGRRFRNHIIKKTNLKGLAQTFNPGRQKIHLEAECDLFFFSAALPRDLPDLDMISNWREQSRFAVCQLQELWIHEIRSQENVLKLLNQFDHVFCPFFHSIEPLQKILSVPVSYMPWSTDAEVFCPYPSPPRRAIDIAGIGQIPSLAQSALIEYADQTGGFFHYQTVFGLNSVKSHKSHRRNYAGILKRSKYFLCYSAKFASEEEHSHQVEFGLRYIEGIAAGTVLLGEKIQNAVADEWLGWNDSIIPLSIDEARPDRLILSIEQNPERFNSVRKENIIQALTKLDHLYRWRDILRIAGLRELPAMDIRQKRLSLLADEVKDTAL